MLDKDPAKRPSAAEIIRSGYIAKQMEVSRLFTLNKTESNPRSYEATKAVAKKAQKKF